MDTNGITPVMPMGDGIGGGSSFMWIFGLIVLLALFNGGFGMGGNGNVNALNADMQRGFDTQNLQAQTRDLMNTSNLNASNVINAVKDGNASIIREFGNVETAISGIAGEMQNCCCSTLRAIDGVNYNTTFQIQKVLDALAANRISELEGKVNSLQLQAATSNVLRFPNAWTYAGGVFPPVQSGTTA